MSDRPRPSGEAWPPSSGGRLDQAWDRFEAAWGAGQRPQIEHYLAEGLEPERPRLFRELLALELIYRRRHAELPTPEEYKGRFPAYAALIDAVFAAVLRSEEAVSSRESVSTGPEPATPDGGEALPARLGRYRVTEQLGRGSFGVVYRGYDDELHRAVAIKVPHPHRISQPNDIVAYLAEARVLASLDHPHIVPVYDFGHTADGRCFVVSKFIEGSDLRQRIQAARPSFIPSAELVAIIAEALHYAHVQGLVHRDVKPGNILLDAAGKPYVTDFGLALREEDFGKGSTFAGTPAYMSPEQARGEGHRVDGRSDVFSLGVVFYELLTGRPPFRGDTRGDLLEQIIAVEVKPPRQIDDTTPKELERICLKALAKRASERYTTAKDFADDLRHFLAHAPEAESPTAAKRATDAAAAPTPGPVPTPASDHLPVRVVPKGLRSFDAHDADFFLGLVPGPRDRDGSPESIRFWKNRVEATDADSTFAVGLLYGPSGCGKSSLVKAGLLPRLAPHVLCVYVEATAQETEARLLKGVRKHIPELPDALGLVEAMAALRRGQGVPAGKKVLVVLDQLEQWLHARRPEENAELVQALRQCDGGRVQCVVLVRDDFWMAATRFLADLEVQLFQGQNCAAVDLFDPRHARKVLAAFGRAFGALPEGDEKLTKEQDAFLDQAVAGLSQDGKVISVRLALFAEMVKGKPWTPATLKEIGGTGGVGVAFLEETFSAPTAPPQHRLHQKAAQAVLKALLPETGTDIKGHMRSWQELLDASGYGGRPKDFEELLRILDGELRLLTPTDPEGAGAEDGPPLARPGGRCYQLTHDYLVQALRDWLTRKQKETRRGRAELRLAERAALWNVKPENRHLPAWWEWLSIRLFTRQWDWTPPQRQMMRKAARYHAVRGLALAGLLMVLTLIGLGVRNRVIEQNRATHAAGLVQRVLDAETAQVPSIVAEMPGYRRWVDPLLREAYAQPETDFRSRQKLSPNVALRRKLHASLALLPADPGEEVVEYLYERLLSATPMEIGVIREALRPHQQGLSRRLWALLEDPKGDPDHRFRAACALAAYDAADPRWDQVSREIAEKLVTADPFWISEWSKLLQPLGGFLLKPLATLLEAERREGVEPRLAANVYRQIAGESSDGFDRLEQRLVELGKMPPPLEEEVASARRQANLGAALVAMGRSDSVWPLLRHSPNPTVRSYLIERLGPAGAEAWVLAGQLDQGLDASARRAIILSLGEFGLRRLPLAEREQLIPRLMRLYRDDPDPGIHGAAGWLLRQWQEEAWLRQVNEAWAKDGEQRERQLEGIKRELVQKKEKAKLQWYVNGQGQTMVVIPGPVEFRMGSPPHEAGRMTRGEDQHRRRIPRSFALATTEVTVAQYMRFRSDPDHLKEVRRFHPDSNGPINLVSWYDAAAYCNWLSKKEGIPEDQLCYEPTAKELSRNNVNAFVTILLHNQPFAATACSSFFVDLKLKENYLSRTGYRLPTEAEWEYACRASAATAWAHGSSAELLPQYAWYARSNLKGEAYPVGSLKPNDLGLFDMHGHMWELCQTTYERRPEGHQAGAVEDKEDAEDIRADRPLVMRGGSGNATPDMLRSAYPVKVLPGEFYYDVGFRVARTIR